MKLGNIGNTWNRRAFLKGVGLGALAISGLPSGRRLMPQAWAAGGQSKFVYAWGTFDTLDPHVKYDVPAAAFNLNLYDNLLRYQGNPPEIVPWLAEAHEVTDGGRRWTFHLRRGVKFHDGSEVTAEAVRFSVERLLALGKAPSAVFKRMGLTRDHVHALDPYTVEIRLDQPFGPFRAVIPIVSIVNPALITAHAQNGDWGEKWLSRHEAGSGAYQLIRFDPATGFTMTRFSEFWRGWMGKHVEEVEIRIIRETTSRVLALMKGDIHTTDTYLPADQIEKLERNPRIKMVSEESMRLFVLRMNNQREPFTDINVRKAFSHAFNYHSFITEILKGKVLRNPGPIPRTLWGYPKDLQGYEFSLDKAKEYLAQAQLKVTRPIEIQILSDQEQTNQAALLLQSDLAKLGIELRPVKSLFPTIVASTKAVETTPDMWIHWVSTYFVDPENWIGEMYDSSNWGTWKASAWYKNARVDELLRQARAIVEQEERAKLYAEACRMVVADAADIWVYNIVEYAPLAKNVQGFKFCPVGSGQEFWNIALGPQA